MKKIIGIWILFFVSLVYGGQLIIKEFNKIYLKDPASVNKIGIAPPSLSSSWNMVLPNSAGTSGQILSTDGSGNLSWTSAGLSSQWTTSGSDIYFNTGQVGINIIPNPSSNVPFNVKNSSWGLGASFIDNASTNAIEIGGGAASSFVQSFDRTGGVARPFYIAGERLDFISGLGITGVDPSNVKMRLDANGQLGINNNSPATVLDVGGNVHIKGPSTLPYGPTDTGIYFDTPGDNNITLNVAPGKAAFIDFSTPGVDYKGRILYSTVTNSFDFTTNGSSPSFSIDNTGGLVVTTGLNSSLPMNSNKITGLANGTAANDAVNVSQLSAIASGLIWKDPVHLINMIDDSLTTPPGSPQYSDAYLVALGGTGVWTGKDGHIEQWNGTAWVDEGLAAVGSRYCISCETPTLGGGTFLGQDDKIFTITNVTPGSYAYAASYSPANNDAIFVNNPSALHYGHSYVYSTTALKWTEFSGPAALQVGNALAFTGNILNVLFDNSTIDLTGNTLEVKTGGITDTQISSSASISYSKMAPLNTEKVLVTNTSGVLSSSFPIYYDTTNYRLGLGTSTPIQALSIMDQGAGSKHLTFQTTNSANGNKGGISWVSEDPFKDEVAYIKTTRTGAGGAPHDIIFGTTVAAPTTTEKMRITSTGNVEIPVGRLSAGKSSPDSIFDLMGVGGGGDNFLCRKTTSAGSGGLALKPDFVSGKMNIQGTNGALSGVADIIMQYEGGNVSVGAVSPSEKLQVAGNIRISNGANYVNLVSPSTGGGFTFQFPNTTGSNGYILQTNGSGVTSWVANTGGNWNVVNGGDAAYTIQTNDQHVRTTTTLTADRTWVLPICNGSNIGERHEIKNTPAQTFNIILDGNGSDLIDGNLTVTLLPGDSFQVICAVAGTWDVE